MKSLLCGVFAAKEILEMNNKTDVNQIY